MTIDINELRQSLGAVTPEEIAELLDRLEAAEAEALEEARLNGMGSEREAALMAKLEAAEKDAAHQKVLAESALRVAEGWERKCGELRTRIAEMERQEPVAWYSKQYGFVYMSRQPSQFEHGSILYLRNGVPAWRIEGSSKVALLDMASLPHGTVFYTLPGAQGE